MTDSISDAGRGGEGSSAFSSSRASARLGLTLRAVVLSPGIGFASAIKSAERRRRAGKRPSEGTYPYLLSAAAGAAWLLLWLKVGGLFGFRDAPEDTFRVSYLAATVGLGAVLGLAAQAVWSGLAAGASGVERATTRRDLRIAWGAAALPQILALAVLLPLDFAIVGPSALATSSLDDSVSTAWTAFSIALSAALAVWNVYLLARGTRVGLQVSALRAGIVTLAAVIVLAALYAPFIAVSAVVQ